MLGSATARGALVTNVVNFVVANAFDGIILDWEPPVPTTPQQRSDFTFLVKAFYAAHASVGAAIGRNLTIGVCVGDGSGILRQYDMKSLAPMLDRLEVMGYYNYPTFFNTLFPSVFYSQGVKPSQIILGLGFSSSTYANVPFGANNSQPGSPLVFPGWMGGKFPEGGPYTSWGVNQVLAPSACSLSTNTFPSFVLMRLFHQRRSRGTR